MTYPCLLKSTAFSLAALAAVTLPGHADPPTPPVQHVHFTWANLDSNIPGVALHNDSHLINPRGVTTDTHAGTVVADEGSGLLTAYDFLGRPLPVGQSQVTIAVPPASGSGTGAPTGVILNEGAFDPHNATGYFTVTSGQNSGPAQYLVCTADGTIAGVNRDVDPSSAITAVPAALTPADYEGLALSRNGNGDVRLYAANYGALAGSGIDVFDQTFAKVVPSGTFIDANVPAGYAPFNVKHYAFYDRVARKIKRYLIVAYAPKSPTGTAGEGCVSVFDTDGNVVKTLVPQSSGNGLNQPWGMAIARHEPGRRDDVLWVANHGDGTITRFALGNNFSGTPLGAATRPTGEVLQFAGLWGIHFGGVPERSPILEERNEDEFVEIETVLHFSADLGSTSDGLTGQIYRR